MTESKRAPMRHKLTPEQRTQRARLAALSRWSQEDPAVNAARGQAGLPEEAVEAAATALESNEVDADDPRAWFRGHAEGALAAAAPLIVAAELSRLADEMDNSPKWASVTADDVRARAAQLRGEGDDWCNCQAVRGTPNYPGPWHPKGDSVGCLRFGRASVLRGEGDRK